MLKFILCILIQIYKNYASFGFWTGSYDIWNRVFAFENGVLAFEKVVLAFENWVLAFENWVLAFENGVLAFENWVFGIRKGSSGIWKLSFGHVNLRYYFFKRDLPYPHQLEKAGLYTLTKLHSDTVRFSDHAHQRESSPMNETKMGQIIWLVFVWNHQQKCERLGYKTSGVSLGITLNYLTHCRH